MTEKVRRTVRGSKTIVLITLSCFMLSNVAIRHENRPSLPKMREAPTLLEKGGGLLGFQTSE